MRSTISFSSCMHSKYAISGLVAGLGQGLEAGLDQRGDAAAEHGLLAEEVRLGLLREGRLDDARPRAADALGVGERASARLAARRPGGRRAAPGVPWPSLKTSRTRWPGRLGRDHRHVDARGRLDGAEADVEAVGEHQRLAGLQVRLRCLPGRAWPAPVSGARIMMTSARSAACGRRQHRDAARPRPSRASGCPPGRPDDDLDAAVAQVQGVAHGPGCRSR